MFSPVFNSQILPTTATVSATQSVEEDGEEPGPGEGGGPGPGGGIKNNIRTDQNSDDHCDSPANQPMARSISSAEQRQQLLLQLCVFCRLRDPSRTIDQVSENFIQQ